MRRLRRRVRCDRGTRSGSVRRRHRLLRRSHRGRSSRSRGWSPNGLPKGPAGPQSHPHPRPCPNRHPPTSHRPCRNRHPNRHRLRATGSGGASGERPGQGRCQGSECLAVERGGPPCGVAASPTRGVRHSTSTATSGLAASGGRVLIDRHRVGRVWPTRFRLSATGAPTMADCRMAWARVCP